MRKALFLALLASAGCYDTSSAPSCRIQCATDTDCTDGLTCGPGGLCSDGEDCLSPPSCTPDEFIACVDNMAHSCNAAGDGTTDVACANGCNATERRCNDCVPDAMSCSTDMMSVQQCMPNGREQTVTDTCAAGCNPGDGSVAPHCSYISPAWLPDVCDTAATDDMFAPNTSGAINGSLDTSCSSIVTQMSNGSPVGPQICVIRAKSITIGNAITTQFTGTRAIALVADDALTINGTLDVSADQTSNNNGPGVFRVSGDFSSSTVAGGGAGFATAGANGGSTTNGGGGTGGAAIDPLSLAYFAGGARAGTNGGLVNPVTNIVGGGGGGGVLLISCRGTVTIAGTVDANGAGGRGNHDTLGGAGFQPSNGASGGGSGGYVVIQGLSVTISGGVFANGGGGGGGAQTDDGSGPNGLKGQRSTSPAGGGAGALSAGGAGSALGTNAGIGGGATAGGRYGGGGGGGVGAIHTYTPTGVIPTTTGSTISPNYLRKNAVIR